MVYSGTRSVEHLPPSSSHPSASTYMPATGNRTPRKRPISLPTELIQIIAEHVVADNDTKSLNSCSLTFRHLKAFFQRAIRAQTPFNIICLPFERDSKYWKRVTTLVELLEANPHFGRDCIREITLRAECSFTLEDPALRLDFILSCCTELESFTFDMFLNPRDDIRSWTAIYRPIREAMEGVLRLPSLRRASFIAVNLPWATLFRSKKSLDSLTALNVGHISPINCPRHEASVSMALPTNVSCLYLCPLSATALVNAPVPTVGSIARADDEASGLDFTTLETIELTSGYTLGDMGENWPTGFQALLRRAPNLKRLVFDEIKLVHMTGMFNCDPPLDCLATLENIIWSRPPPSILDSSAGQNPFLPVVSLLPAFPFENALKSLALTVCFEDLPTNKAQILEDFRLLTDALAKKPFSLFERAHICAQVENISSQSARIDRMLADLRYVVQELQNMKYPFVLEVKVEECDSSLRDGDL